MESFRQGNISSQQRCWHCQRQHSTLFHHCWQKLLPEEHMLALQTVCQEVEHLLTCCGATGASTTAESGERRFLGGASRRRQAVQAALQDCVQVVGASCHLAHGGDDLQAHNTEGRLGGLLISRLGCQPVSCQGSSGGLLFCSIRWTGARLHDPH